MWSSSLAWVPSLTHAGQGEIYQQRGMCISAFMMNHQITLWWQRQWSHEGNDLIQRHKSCSQFVSGEVYNSAGRARWNAAIMNKSWNLERPCNYNKHIDMWQAIMCCKSKNARVSTCVAARLAQHFFFFILPLISSTEPVIKAASPFPEDLSIQAGKRKTRLRVSVKLVAY